MVDTQFRLVRYTDSKGAGCTKMTKSGDKSAWVIWGATLIGVGVGLILLKTSALLFVASVLVAIASGLVIAPLIILDKGQ